MISEIDSILRNTNGPSIAREAMTAVNKNEMPLEVATKHVAMHTANTLQDHQPKKYPPLSQAVSNYQNARKLGMSSRDSELAIKNGEWLCLVYQAMDHNRKECEYFLWAIEHCISAKAGESAKKIDTHLNIFRGNIFPSEAYKNGRLVQEMDINERRRNESTT